MQERDPCPPLSKGVGMGGRDVALGKQLVIYCAVSDHLS